MYNEQEFNEDNVPRHNSKNIESSMKEEVNFLRIYDLIEPVFSTNKQIFEITERVFSQYRNHFDMYENLNLRLNHLELSEFTYKLVESAIQEILRLEYKSIDDLMEINLNTLTLFIQPNDITEDENKWVESLLSKQKGEREMEIKLPVDAEKNYFINLKRILDKNNSNPDFNESILNLFDRTRVPH